MNVWSGLTTSQVIGSISKYRLRSDSDHNRTRTAWECFDVEIETLLNLTISLGREQSQTCLI